MPIIPSNWTGLDTVNAIGGSGGLTGYAYAKQLTTTITELDTFIDLIGVCNEPISREVSLDLITGRLKLYWKNLDGTYTQLHRDNLIFNTGYKVVDLTLGQLGLSIKCSEVTELFLVVRWDKDVNFNIYTPPVIPLPLLVEITNNNIVSFSNYDPMETFTVVVGETFLLGIGDPESPGYGNPFYIMGYFKSSFTGLYSKSNFSLKVLFNENSDESDRIIEFSINFDSLLLAGFSAELKFMEGRLDEGSGRPNNDVIVFVVYNDLTRTFTVNK